MSPPILGAPSPTCASHLTPDTCRGDVSRDFGRRSESCQCQLTPSLSHTQFIVAGLLSALDVLLCLSFTLQCYTFPGLALTPSLLFHPLLTPAQSLHIPSCALPASFSASDFKFCLSSRSSYSKKGKGTCPGGKLLRKMSSTIFALQELPGWAQGGWASTIIKIPEWFG